MSKAEAYLKLLQPRRTVYGLSRDNFPLSARELKIIILDTIAHTPTAFNSQTTRVVLLINEHHERLWGEIAPQALKAVVPPSRWQPTGDKLARLRRGYGTVLFFEDEESIETLTSKFPPYAKKFPEWAANASGAAQIHIWTALAQANVGANLQHYNPIIDQAVAAEWNIPKTWRLCAQLVFGSIVEPPGKKRLLPATEWFKVFE